MSAIFAEVMNGIQTQGWIEQSDGTYIPDPNATSFSMSIGTDSNGDKILASPTQKIFVASDGSTTINASNIAVNSNLRNNLSGISAALVSGTSSDFTNTVEISGQTGKQYTLVNEIDRYAVGNGKSMGVVINTRTSTKSALLQNLSPEDFLMAGVAKIGVQSESIANQEEAQSSICDSTKSRLLSETSVDLNEELTDMIKYQRSYEASARVFNACCDILNVLVNLGA